VLFVLEDLLFSLLLFLFHVLALALALSEVSPWYPSAVTSRLALPGPISPSTAPVTLPVNESSVFVVLVLVVEPPSFLPVIDTLLVLSTLLVESITSFPVSSVWLFISVRLSFQSFDNVHVVVFVVAFAIVSTIELAVDVLILLEVVIVSETSIPLLFPSFFITYNGTFSICPIS